MVPRSSQDEEDDIKRKYQQIYDAEIKKLEDKIKRQEKVSYTIFNKLV